LQLVPQILVIHEAPSTLEPIDLHRHSLTEQVYDAIRDAIVSKALPPGIRLSEAALAEKFGVSKTPVREALLRLGAVDWWRARPAAPAW
jgi:DNA-binding GntR family transcriptional regulator